MIQKPTTAMYKIGDFSHMGQVSVRMLRHYDQLGLLKPGHVDRFTNYRYYTAEQLPRLHRILALRDLGLSLDEIGTVMQEDLSVAQLHDLLRAKQREIEDQLRAETARLQRVAARLREIEQEGAPPRFDVVIKPLAAQMLLAVRRRVPSIDHMPQYREDMLDALYSRLNVAHIAPGVEMVVYHATEYIEVEIDMSVAVVHEGKLPTKTVDQLSPDVSVLHLPATPSAAAIVHHGKLYEVADVVPALYRWLGEHGFASDGAYRELHIFGRELDICAEIDRHDVVYEVQVPIVPLGTG